MEKQGRSGILFRCFKEHTKIGLDICAGTCYNIVRKCGHRTSASISAFQAEEVGSIPIARSTIFGRQFVKNWRLSLCSDPVFDPVFYFWLRKGLYLSTKKKAPSGRFGSKGALLLYALYADFLLSLTNCKQLRTIFVASRKWSPTFAWRYENITYRPSGCEPETRSSASDSCRGRRKFP